MTAIVRTRTQPSPPRARAGLLLPGLGHLLTGEWINGIGLLSLDLLLVGSAMAGFPRLGEILFDPVSGGLVAHPVIAVLSWLLLAAGLWWVALRKAYPRPLSEDEYNSNRQIFLRTFGRHRTGRMGLFGVTFLVVVTILAPLLAPYDPLKTYVGTEFTPPSWDFPMGTDNVGRDVFSRLLYGGRISMTIGFVSVFIAATLGTTLGATAAFLGGVVDRAIMFLTDALISLPRLVLLITIAALFRVKGPAAIYLMVVVLGFTAWMGIARIVRSEVLSLKQRDFVQAARALGLSQTRILFVHLIPNAMGPVIVFCSLAVGGTMLAEAALSFLGLGVQPPIPTWGVMVNDGRETLRSAPWASLFPGLAITMAVLSFNLLGDGLRDALDPKLRG